MSISLKHGNFLKVWRASTNSRIRCNHQENTKQDKSCNDYESFYHQNYIPTSTFQKLALGIGSAAVSILNPRRGDMIACMGETTGVEAIKFMKSQMELSGEGSDILNERPRINSKTVDLDKLEQMPEGTLGKTYSNFLKINNVTPDARNPVQFVDDIHLAYVMQRYREAHDLFHTILGMRTNMLGEVTVKWVEAIQTRLPMCIGGALFGPIRLKPKHRELYQNYYLPWAIQTGYKTKFLLNLYFEKRWEQELTDLYKEINFTPLILPEIKKVQQ